MDRVVALVVPADPMTMTGTGWLEGRLGSVQEDLGVDVMVDRHHVLGGLGDQADPGLVGVGARLEVAEDSGRLVNPVRSRRRYSVSTPKTSGYNICGFFGT